MSNADGSLSGDTPADDKQRQRLGVGRLGVGRLGVHRLGVRILPFIKWLRDPCYRVEWLSARDPICIGLHQCRCDVPPFWINRPIRVRRPSGECSYGVVRRVAIGDAIHVEWDAGYPHWSDLDPSREDIELLHPYVSVHKVVAQWARQLYSALEAIAPGVVFMDETDFVCQFLRLIYSASR